jgi:hypothetical protein
MNSCDASSARKLKLARKKSENECRKKKLSGKAYSKK